MPVKPTAIVPQDLVLIHLENKPAFFARVEDINPDIRRGWWQVKLFILALPLKVVTWIIDDDQIRGEEFTMGGVPVRIDRVTPPPEAGAPPPEPGESKITPHERKPARILSMTKNPKHEVDSL